MAADYLRGMIQINSLMMKNASFDNIFLCKRSIIHCNFTYFHIIFTTMIVNSEYTDGSVDSHLVLTLLQYPINLRMPGLSVLSYIFMHSIHLCTFTTHCDFPYQLHSRASRLL